MTDLKLTGSRREVLVFIAESVPDAERPTKWIVFATDGYNRMSFFGIAGDIWARKVTRQCEDMAAAGWIELGEELPPMAYYRPARPWLITDAGRAALAVGQAPVSVRLTLAQAQRIESAHFNGGEFVIVDQSWVGEVDNRNSVHAMVRAGLMAEIGPDPTDASATVFGLTDDGRRAYATSSQVIRHDRNRCGNPICCGVWPEDPGQPRTHGSCLHCARWVKCGKDGRVNRHNIQPGRPCPGYGQLYEGHPDIPSA